MAKKVYGPTGSKIIKPDLSKYRKMISGDMFQVGDLIHTKNMFNNDYREIVRVTKTSAIIMYNETAEGIFRITQAGDHPSPKPLEKFSTTTYTGYKKINP